MKRPFVIACAWIIGASAVAHAGGSFDISDSTSRHAPGSSATIQVSNHGFSSTNYNVFLVTGSRTGNASLIKWFNSPLPSTITVTLPGSLPAPCYLRVTAAGKAGSYTATAMNAFGQINVIAQGKPVGTVLQDAGRVSVITSGNKAQLAPLIGHDGASLIGQDGAGLIGERGAGLH